MKFADLILRIYSLVILAANILKHPYLLIIRLYWGYAFFVTGKGKLMDIENKTAFFEQLNIPFPQLNVILAGSTECIGGLLLVLGLGSRIAAIPLIGTMCVAYATAHKTELLGVFEDPNAFLDAPPFLFLCACVVVFLFGPGIISFDAIIAWWLKKKTGKSLPPSK